MAKDKELLMSFDPSTIQHLGIRMYSTLPPVVAELIANSFDADANNVDINLVDEKDRKLVIVSDDGAGMTFDEINSKFLRIGRDRRHEEKENETAGGRKVIGKKGIGKLSFFGIADEIIITTCKDKKLNQFRLNWESIKKSTGGSYNPDILIKDKECPKDKTGTEIALEIKRRSDFDPNALAVNLSKIFIFDKDFKVTIRHNGSHPVMIDNKMRFSGLDQQFTWKFPFAEEATDKKYKNRTGIKGVIITTEKPIPPSSGLRGITLFSRNKLVNLPEYFSSSASSHFFSYLTGWLEVDFIDDLDEDVISTNRQSLNWDHPETEELREYLAECIFLISRDWRKKRADERTKEAQTKTGINLDAWYDSVGDLKNDLESVINLITSESELSDDKQDAVIQTIHNEFLPEYPRYHWRHLHNEIRDAVREYYKNKQYFEAAIEATKIYIEAVRGKSGSSQRNDSSMMGEVFGKDNGLLVVTDNNDAVTGDIEEGHKFLSIGLVFGFKNTVVSHSSIQRIQRDGLFTEKDCLDILSLISHLLCRMDSAKLRT